MLFDTWAGLLSPAQFHRHVIDPAQTIVDALRQSHPGSAGHRFPRLARSAGGRLRQGNRVNGVGLDTSMDPALAAAVVPQEWRCRAILIRWHWLEEGRRCSGDRLGPAALKGRPSIFNLGTASCLRLRRSMSRAGGAGACGLGSPSSCSTWAGPIGRRRSGPSYLISFIIRILRVPFFLRPSWRAERRRAVGAGPAAMPRSAADPRCSN